MPDRKISKKDARYQTYPKATKRCWNCTMFRQPDVCTLVMGPVSPNGWCRYHEDKK